MSRNYLVSLSLSVGSSDCIYILFTCVLINDLVLDILYNTGAPVLQKFFKDSWYVMNPLNVHLPEVVWTQSNRLYFTFSARDWHSSRGKCSIQLKRKRYCRNTAKIQNLVV